MNQARVDFSKVNTVYILLFFSLAIPLAISSSPYLSTVSSPTTPLPLHPPSSYSSPYPFQILHPRKPLYPVSYIIVLISLSPFIVSPRTPLHYPHSLLISLFTLSHHTHLPYPLSSNVPPLHPPSVYLCPLTLLLLLSSISSLIVLLSPSYSLTLYPLASYNSSPSISSLPVLLSPTPTLS